MHLLKTLDDYLTVIESDCDSAILFTYSDGPVEGFLKTAFGDCEIKKRKSHVVYGCDGAHNGDDCGICNIMDHAEIYHFPVVLFFKNRILKG